MSDWSQPAMFDDPHARRSDPTSSHVAVGTIAKWVSLNDAILTAARNCGEIPFDDTDLTVMVCALRGSPVQRNVVARARGLLERDGHLVRLGLKQRDDRRTLHFQYNDGHRVGIVVEPRPKLVEIEADALVAGNTQYRRGAEIVLEFQRPYDRDVAWRSIQKQMDWNN